MAASGGSGLKGSIYKGSSEDFELTCEPCKDDGNFVEASGYCQNCDEYLCIECKKAHCRPRPSRHHVVLDKQQMPLNKQRTSKVTLCTELCKKHPSECLKFFCKKHEVTGCGDCIILDHKTCDVDYISTLADGYTTSTEYTSIILKVEQLQTEVNDKLRDAGQTATKAEATIQKAMADIKQYRKYVDAYFDKAERILSEQCDEIKKRNQCEMKKLSDELKSSCTDLSSFHESITSNIANNANLFVRTKESRSMLVDLEKEMKAINITQLKCVEFMKNVTLTSEISTATSFGALQESNLPIYTSKQRKRVIDLIPQHKADICMKVSTENCYISGIVHVRENIIACTDWQNNVVKLVDINHKKLLSTVSVMQQPWDITSISQNTFAVTLTTSCKIQFLEVQNDVLSKKNVIGVKGKCRGIDCNDDKLVVSYADPGKVEILDLHGNVLRLVQTDNVGNDLFKCPYYVVFSQDGGSIYVSDDAGKSIIKLTLDGTVQTSYKHTDLENPRGMFVCRDGSLLVCDFWSVHVISDDGKKQKILLTKTDGVDIPSGISFDEEKGTLCIRKYGNNVPDVIQTFRLV